MDWQPLQSGSSGLPGLSLTQNLFLPPHLSKKEQADAVFSKNSSPVTFSSTAISVRWCLVRSPLDVNSRDKYESLCAGNCLHSAEFGRSLYGVICDTSTGSLPSKHCVPPTFVICHYVHWNPQPDCRILANTASSICASLSAE